MPSPGTPKPFGPIWGERLMDYARSFIVRDRDGAWVFWPSHGAGPWNADALRLIDDELERRNREDYERLQKMKDRLEHAKRVASGEVDRE